MPFSQPEQDYETKVEKLGWKGRLKKLLGPLWLDFWRDSPLVTSIFALIFVLSMIFALFAMVAGGWYIWNFHVLLGSSDATDSWTDFATFMGFAVQAMLGGATLVAALFLSGILTHRLEKRRTDEAQSRELVRLSEKMVDTEFYMKVMYPAWEVALKWMDDDMPGIHAYRADVIGGEMRLPKMYRQRQGRLALAENNPRLHPHYQPYDVPVPPNGENGSSGGPAVIAELSESLAFATWIRFWRNVTFLIDERVVDEGSAKGLFREWYLWWAPFMVEFIGVCEEVRRRVLHRYSIKVDTDGWSQSSIHKLAWLHKYLGISDRCGYRKKEDADKRIKLIVDAAIGQIYEAIDSDPDYELIGSAIKEPCPSAASDDMPIPPPG